MFLALEQLGLRYPGALPAGAGEATAPRPAAVDAVSLNLARGQIGVLIGPSGCGKTSLLRCIAGLERPQAGRIVVDGEVLTDAAAGLHRPPETRQVGMVFQDYALFPHLSVADNVGFGLRHLAREPRRQRIEEVLGLVGLAHAGRRAPHQLSGGQQQRVALARALAPAPRLLLLDEPFSSLDVDLREHLSQELRAILQASGTTALFVTHDQGEALALGDVVGVMNHGRLEQWDAPPAVYHRPATRFVADFLGHGVFAPARVGTTPEGRRLITPLGPLPVPDTVAPDAELEVLLRADDIVHDETSPVKARIERRVFRGAESLYTLRLADGERLLARLPSRPDHEVGDWIGVRAAPETLVTFDRPARAGAE